MSALGVSRTIVRLGAQSIFGRWRGALLFVLPVVLIGLSILVRTLVGHEEMGARHALDGLGLTVVVPLVALLATSGLLAPEIDDGSISYLLAKPISRHTIVASKLVVAAACVLVFAVAPVLVAALILRPSYALGFAVGALLGGLAYCSLFAFLSILTRHAVVIGLIYLLVWEGLLGGLLDGVRWLSVTRWSAAVVEQIADVSLVDDLPLGYALPALVVVVVGGAWVTGRRLRGFNLTGDE
ncbi:MAG: ABC transporter permease subunit [Nocardioides sp.]|nr:ABC transporter permease subunit [Nocardioides sp.]